jgi:hypothetical protein
MKPTSTPPSSQYQTCEDEPPSLAPASDDTTQILRAVGRQLRADFRCGRLLFRDSFLCRTEPHTGCTDTMARRLIGMVMSGAGGSPCDSNSCRSDDSAFAVVYLLRPEIGRDSASVVVEVSRTQQRDRAHNPFTRFRYLLLRPPPGFPWVIRARYTESWGHYSGH